MKPFRLLLIEDDSHRIDMFRSWLPCDVILTVATSGGQALGLLKRVQPGEYAGLLLDHDLREQMKTIGELKLSGTDMVDRIIESFEREIAVLVHSQNPGGGRSMAERLDRAGFWVTRVPFSDITEDRFREWVEDVREDWLDRST